jgi:hypothetical protein
MNQPATCGKGLSERSVLPTRLSALCAAIADNLEKHQHALDLTDENARTERDAYRVLANDFRDVASQLQAIADRMVGYRDLPVSRHGAGALATTEIRDALANMLERERDVIALLTAWIELDRTILAGMS